MKKAFFPRLIGAFSILLFSLILFLNCKGGKETESPVDQSLTAEQMAEYRAAGQLDSDQEKYSTTNQNPKSRFSCYLRLCTSKCYYIFLLGKNYISY